MIYRKNSDNIIEAAYSVTKDLLKKHLPSKPVVIKPNIVEPIPPPVTTDVRVVEGIIAALKDAGVKEIIVTEGSGTGDTIENFRKLGYSRLDAGLIDLDKEETAVLPVSSPKVWKEINVPGILLDKFIISVPVLKEHSMLGVTISLKNMIGILPAKHYSGYWTYKKSQVHKYDTSGCINDIINVVKPAWAIVDATIGMKGSHLSGTPLQPPLNLVYGSSDPLEADKFGCELLKRNWKGIAHLRMIANDRSISRER